MNINGAFPSDYLKAADLNGRPFVLKMGNVTLEDIGSDRKPVLHFQGTEKGLVLNKTNASTISTLYGDETDEWFGNPIEVYPSETDFQGKRMPCIRVRRPGSGNGQPQRQQAPQSYEGNQALPSASEELDDSVPF